MKKLFIILIALLIGVGGGYLIYSKFFNGSASLSKKVVTADNYKEPFMWGVTMRPNALGNYNDQIWNKQLKVASNLGIKWVRMGWSYDAPDQFDFHDPIIESIKSKGLDVYLVIEPSTIFENVQDPYKDGYDNALRIASHYKGQIKYYQIMNEAGSNALIDGLHSGENESDYDPTKYQRTRDWIKGASEGVAKADPSAYRVLTNQWLQTGFLEKLKKDNIEYDIIGWDWFSDMGWMRDKKLADNTLLIDKLRSFNKPIILAEVNQRPEGKNGQKGQNEEDQAAFIKEMANWSVDAKLKGFMVLELLDVTNSGKGYTDYYGIVEAKKSSGGSYVPGDPRKAFTVFQEIIKNYNEKN